MFLRKTLFVLLCAGSLPCLQAQTFQKFYRNADRTYHSFQKMVRVNDNTTAFITTTEFYRIDQKGEILLQKRIGGGSLYLNELIPAANGEFWIGMSDYSGSSPVIRLLRIDASGNTLQQKTIDPGSSFAYIQIVPSSNGSLFLTYSHTSGDDKHVDVIYLDANLNEVWKKEYPNHLRLEVLAIPGGNNGVEIVYNTTEDPSVLHFKLDVAGNESTQPVRYNPSQDGAGRIRHAIKTPDGGYLYTGFESDGFTGENIILLKTDSDGKPQWKKNLNFFLSDIDDAISVIDNGYMLCVNAGIDRALSDQDGAEIVLAKLNSTGDIQWKKAYGTGGMDYTRAMLVNADGSMLIGGQGTTYYGETMDPIVIRTDRDGNIQESPFPYPLINPSPIVQFNPDPNSSMQKLVNGTPLPGGGLMLASAVAHYDDDEFYPFLTRTDEQGAVLWHKELPDRLTELVCMKAMPDGAILTLTMEENILFMNNFYLSKFDADGKLSWGKPIYANSLRDIVQAPDGGYLVCGMEYESMGIEVQKLSVVKLNSTGDEEWKFTHRIQGKSITGRSMVVTPENEIVVTGIEKYLQDIPANVFLAKIDMQGRLKWYRSYPHGTEIAVGNKLIRSSDNNYVITGYVRDAGTLNKQDVLLMKTTAQGDLLWQKLYNIDKYDAGNGLLEVNGHYFIGGTAGLPEFGPRESFGFAMKTDLNGSNATISAFGNKGSMLTCTDLYAAPQNKVQFMGTVQEMYGIERPFSAVLGMDIVLSAYGPEIDKRVQLYPVPAVSTAFLNIDHSYIGKIRISITGISGVRMYQKEQMKTQTVMRIPLQLSGYSSGTYLVEIEMGKERIVKKLMIGKP